MTTTSETGHGGRVDRTWSGKPRKKRGRKPKHELRAKEAREMVRSAHKQPNDNDVAVRKAMNDAMAMFASSLSSSLAKAAGSQPSTQNVPIGSVLPRFGMAPPRMHMGRPFTASRLHVTAPMPPMPQPAISTPPPAAVNVGISMFGRKVLGRRNPGRVSITACQAEDAMFITPDLSKKKGDNFDSLDKGARQAKVRKQEQTRVGSSNYGQKATDYAVSQKAIDGDADVLVIDHPNADISITNGKFDKGTGKFVPNGVKHDVSIRREEGIKSDALGNLCRKIGDIWRVVKGNASRKNYSGEMFAAGSERGTGSGKYQQLLKGPTRLSNDGKDYVDLNKTHAELNVLAKEIAEVSFPRACNSIQKAMHGAAIVIPDIIGGGKGLAPCFNQSGKKSIIQSHYDKDIAPESIVYWHSTDGKDPPGWYFFMPDCFCEVAGKKYRGVAVRLRDGVGISWRGGDLRHGSTFPDEYTGDLLGTWFGILVR